MSKQKTTEKQLEVPQPEKQTETQIQADPKEPFIPAEDPDRAPYEIPFEVPPYELPPPGEDF